MTKSPISIVHTPLCTFMMLLQMSFCRKSKGILTNPSAGIPPSCFPAVFVFLFLFLWYCTPVKYRFFKSLSITSSDFEEVASHIRKSYQKTVVRLSKISTLLFQVSIVKGERVYRYVLYSPPPHISSHPLAPSLTSHTRRYQKTAIFS